MDRAATPRPARDRLGLLVLLVVATVCTYAPAITAGFIWNDRDYVTAPILRSLDGLRRIWFEVGATEQYYPVLHGFFWVQHRLWGEAAAGYHVTSILLHAASACILALILLRLRLRGAWLAAFLFALHPVCVESVAWISEQKNTLSTLCYLLAALAYLRFDATRARPAYAGALALFVLALLSKSVTATLPAALLVVLWWQRGRLDWRRDVIPLLPWFVLGAAMGLFSGWVEREYVGATGADFALIPLQRLLIAGRAVWFYVGKLAWPVDLQFIYPRWEVDPAAAWQYLFPLAVGLALVGLWRLRRRTRGPLAAALYYGGSLFPVLGFFNVYAFIFSFVTDHWQYQPAIGILTLSAAGLATGLAAAPRLARLVGPVLLVVTLGFLSFQQSRRYRDIETFYRAIIAENPAAWMAHNNLGQLLEQRGDLAGALRHYETAVRIKPAYPEVHNNLGALLARDPARIDEAIAQYEEALRLNPALPEAHSNLAMLLAGRGRLADALAHYAFALRVRPHNAGVHYNLAIELARLPGRLDEAIAHFEAAIRADPAHAEAHGNLGAALARVPGRAADAIAHYERALQLKPGYAEAHNNLANELAKLPGRLPEAIDHYEQALRINPNFTAAHYNLANKLARLPGRSGDAIRHFEQAVQIDPGFAAANYSLGLELAKMPERQPDALRFLTAAVQLDPKSINARKALAEVLARNGQGEAAMRQLESVLADQPADEGARQALAALKAAAPR